MLINREIVYISSFTHTLTSTQLQPRGAKQPSFRDVSAVHSVPEGKISFSRSMQLA